PNPMRTIPYNPMALLSVERSLAVPSFVWAPDTRPYGGWGAGSLARGHGRSAWPWKFASTSPCCTYRPHPAGEGRLCLRTRYHSSVHFKRGPSRVTDGVPCRMGGSTMSPIR
ncbi:hypothetical protein TraAM80_09119, partial [Trypanosoma rangeli]